MPDALAADHRAAFAADVRDGLARAQKAIPSRWLYDAHGSALFEQITQLPEYYPTRTETAILRQMAGTIAAQVGRGATLVEYGAGASVKTRILLDALDGLAAYVPIDVSAAFLHETARGLRTDYPALAVEPVVADFLAPIALPAALHGTGPRLGFFPGSTIGNLSDAEIVAFLGRARADLGPGAQFILGADLKKSPAILIPAYDDATGVTAAFNLNLLTRINRELAGSFDVSAFRHEARWNDDASRIEMHLVSTADQTARVGDGLFAFPAGETIHTENSRKFTIDGDLAEDCAHAGWTIEDRWTDAASLFAVLLLRAG